MHRLTFAVLNLAWLREADSETRRLWDLGFRDVMKTFVDLCISTFRLRFHAANDDVCRFSGRLGRAYCAADIWMQRGIAFKIPERLRSECGEW